MNRKLTTTELNRISLEDFKTADKTPIVVVLDNIRSLNNVGSVFRTADSFIIEAVYLCGITAKPPHKDIQKTALGAQDAVNWLYSENTIDAVQDLKKEGYSIVAVEQAENTISLDDFYPQKNQKIALVFGNEVQGVNQDVIDISNNCIEVPQFGTKHSLNISVCVGIVLWDLIKKIKLS